MADNKDNAPQRKALEEPAFLDDEGPSAEIPPFITTTNARELYDLQPGETVPEAIARQGKAAFREQCERWKTEREKSA